MPREDRVTWKSSCFLKIIQLLDDNLKCFTVGADSMDSTQMQPIHLSVRRWDGCGVDRQEHRDARGHPRASGEQPSSGGTVASYLGESGFCVTKEDLTEIRDMLLANKVPAAAGAGATAPYEVTVPAQDIGLGSKKTSFFQALGIATKISRGTIEILKSVCDVASICLQMGYPVASVPHSTINGYKGVLALSVETDDTFPLLKRSWSSWLIHLHLWLLPLWPDIAPAKVEAKEELEESNEDMGFGVLD
uniref:Large ribosomal subunit protein uL10 n=1 Tax=Ursus americanus TaxID=9643 RepID=A0A452SJ38_URSAM